MEAVAKPNTKPYKGMGMEGSVAKWYAKLTKKALPDFRALARRVAAEIPANSSVLEAAPGPGYFAIELAKLGAFRITGLDISETFVQLARDNAQKAGVTVDFQRGDAANMPFESESFDFLLCRAAFKNFTEPVRALREMHRVLKPAAQALIIDLRRDASRASIGKSVDEMHLGPVNGLLVRLTFRFMLLKRAYTKAEFERFLAQTPFQNGEIRENATGFEICLRK